MLHRKVCKTPGCKNLHFNRSGYCDECQSMHQASYRYRRIVTAGTDLEEKRPSASERGYDHQWHLFAKKFLRDHPKCAICGRPATVCDHKTMTAWQMIDMYGSFILDETMYQPLCQRCNIRKGANADKVSDRRYQADKDEFLKGLPKGDPDA